MFIGEKKKSESKGLKKRMIKDTKCAKSKAIKKVPINLFLQYDSHYVYIFRLVS